MFLHHSTKWLSLFLLPMLLLAFYSSSAFTDDQHYTMTSDSTEEKKSSHENKYLSALDNAISDYKKIAENSGWPEFQIGKAIKIGMQDERIPAVRQILTIMGDYDGASSDADILDEPLVLAVQSFQTRHGLDADGAIGSKTQAALAIPVGRRIAQLEATKERMNHMPDLGNRYILVNIAGYYLNAVEDDHTVIQSRIIVGTPKNSTPLFQRPINAISFNPQWHVPNRIAQNEMMPKLRNNPEYFEKSNFVVKDRDGEIVDVHSINWEDNEDNHYKFVQRSGSSNALGKVKFSLPDTDNIYLHSTANPKLFQKAERALSHGCVRVEMAKELVHFVMKDMEDWNEEKISKLYDSNTSKILNIEPVPVYLAYWTSWVDENSKKVHFNSDIYKRDKKRIDEIYAAMKENADYKLAMK